MSISPWRKRAVCTQAQLLVFYFSTTAQVCKASEDAASGDSRSSATPRGVAARSLLQVLAGGEVQQELARPRYDEFARPWNGTQGGITTEEAEDFVRIHNFYRCLHGAPPIVWSDQMAANAYTHVKDLTDMVHSDSFHIPPPAGPASENLYWTTPEYRTVARICRLWYREVNFCIGGPENFTDGCRNSTHGEVYHFTAMVWTTAKYIGCAWSDMRQVAICRYKGGDELDQDTPNTGLEPNFIRHVLPRNTTADHCNNMTATTNATNMEIPAEDDINDPIHQAPLVCRCLTANRFTAWKQSPCNCLGIGTLEERYSCAEGDSNCTMVEDGVSLGSQYIAAAEAS